MCMHPEIANTPRMFLNGEKQSISTGFGSPQWFFMPTDLIDVQNNIFFAYVHHCTYLYYYIFHSLCVIIYIHA